MKTIIYSCGSGTTSRELAKSLLDTGEYNTLDAVFPEVQCPDDEPLIVFPLTEEEQLGLLDRLIGKTFVTTSETIISMFLREIRKGRIRTDEFELYCAGRRIEVSTDGGLIDWWDGGFFETGFYLRFD